jgi:hypothetical protein
LTIDADTIRCNLFKACAPVTIGVRRINLPMASGCRYRAAFATAHRAHAALAADVAESA